MLCWPELKTEQSYVLANLKPKKKKKKNHVQPYLKMLQNPRGMYNFYYLISLKQDAEYGGCCKVIEASPLIMLYDVIHTYLPYICCINIYILQGFLV